MVFGWVLIFFKFWYLDGYDFKALGGTPCIYFYVDDPRACLKTNQEEKPSQNEKTICVIDETLHPSATCTTLGNMFPEKTAPFSLDNRQLDFGASLWQCHSEPTFRNPNIAVKYIILVLLYYLLCRSDDLLSRTCDLLSRTYDILSRTYDLLSRTYDLLCCTYDLLSRTYDLLSRTYDDLLSRTYDILSRTYDLLLSRKEVVSSVYIMLLLWCIEWWIMSIVRRTIHLYFCSWLKLRNILKLLHIFLNIFNALESPDHI